jgi:hypothetical protein
MAQPTVATALSTASTSNTRDISLVSELAETKQVGLLYHWTGQSMTLDIGERAAA